MRLLFANILADKCFIKANGAYTVTACPKVVSGQIFPFAKIATVEQYRGFTFQPPYCLRHSVTWWDAQTHVDMIRPRMTFDQLYAKLIAQLSKYHPDLLTKPSKYRFLPIFGDEDDMIKAVPSDVGLLFPFSHRLYPPYTARRSRGLSLFYTTIQTGYGRTFYGHTAGGGGLTDL